MYGKMDLRQLVDELERQKKNRYDIIVPTESLKVVYDVGYNKILMSVPQPDDSFKMHSITQNANNQIAEKTGIPQKYYDKMLQEQKYQLFCDNVNTWLPSKDKRMIRVLDNEVRALLSDRYRPIDNYDIVFLLLEKFKELQEQGFRVEIKQNNLTEQHLYIKAISYDLSGKVKHKDKLTDVYGGIVISNSEVGVGSFNVNPFMFVPICTNGLISENSFRKIHLGKERGCGLLNWSDETLNLQDLELWSSIKDLVNNTFNLDVFQKWIDQINGVSSIEIDKPIIAVENTIKKFDLPKTLKDDLINQFTKEGNTLWGLSMALTNIAQKQEVYENQIKFEEIGNQILNTPIEVLVKE